MKSNILLFFLFGLSFQVSAQGFIYHKSEDSNRVIQMSAFELSSKKILAYCGFYITENHPAEFILLDSMGEFLDKVVVDLDTLQLFSTDYVTLDDQFVVVGSVGRYFEDQGIVETHWMWYARYSNDLELLASELVNLDFRLSSLSLVVESDSIVVFVGKGIDTNYLSSATGRIDYVQDSILALEKKYDWHPSPIFILGDRIDSVGYVVSGNSWYTAIDDNFEVVKEYRKIDEAPYPERPGSIVPYTDSTYLTASVCSFGGYLDVPAIEALYVAELDLDLHQIRWDSFAQINRDETSNIVYTGEFRNVAKTQENTYYTGGANNLPKYLAPYDTPCKIVIRKYDNEFNVLWEKMYGDSEFLLVLNLSATADGGCLISGLRRDYIQDLPLEGFVMKINSAGQVVGNTAIPLHQYDVQVSPNPTHSTLQFDLPEGLSVADMQLVDINGRVVLTQKISREPVDISFLPQGVYVYQVSGVKGELIGVGKVVVE